MSRDTRWLQGGILEHADISIFLSDKNIDEGLALVVSHDCDLANEDEETIEIVVATPIENLDPQYVNGRHPRILHLSGPEEIDGERWLYEIKQNNRIMIKKSTLESEKGCRDNWRLDEKELKTFRHWLAARYSRPAFPNSFEDRLRTKYNSKSNIAKHLAKCVDPVANHLLGVFFDLQGERYTELESSEPYFIAITLVYNAEEGAKGARLAASEAAIAIQQAFDKIFRNINSNAIVLERCDVVADTKFTLSDLMKTDRWRFEFMSFREEPPKPIPSMN